MCFGQLQQLQSSHSSSLTLMLKGAHGGRKLCSATLAVCFLQALLTQTKSQDGGLPHSEPRLGRSSIGGNAQGHLRHRVLWSDSALAPPILDLGPLQILSHLKALAGRSCRLEWGP